MIVKRAFLNVQDIFVNKYGKIEGKADRFEFWSFALFCYALYLLSFLLNFIPILGPVLASLLVLSLIVPYITTAIRRLHSIGFNMVLALLPLVFLALGLLSLAFASIYLDKTLLILYPIFLYSALGTTLLVHILLLLKERY